MNLPAGENFLKLDPATTAILVVDMQNDFCADDGFYARHGSDIASFKSIITTVADLIGKARAAGVTIAFARLIYGPPRGAMNQRHRIMPRRWPSLGERLLPDTRGVQIVDALRPHPSDIVIDKAGYSSFEGTVLEDMFRKRGIKTVVLTGVVAYACVLATAFSAFDKDFDVVFVSDAVASWGDRLEKEAGEIVDLLLGAVATANTLVFAEA